MQFLQSLLKPKEDQSQAIYDKRYPVHERPIFFSRPSETFAVGYSPREFQELTGVVYLPHLQFLDLDTLIRVKTQCARAYRLNAIDSSMKWLGAFYKKELSTGFVNDVAIRWINEEIGFGVFANRTIKKGEFIGEYTGVVKRCRFFHKNVNDYCFHYPIYNLLINVHTIDAEKKGNETRFINHKIEGNCTSFICYYDHLLHVCIRAREEIPVIQS